jgi:hypothetical protein
MSDAPDRLSIKFETHVGFFTQKSDGVEYIRADIAEARIAELEARPVKVKPLEWEKTGNAASEIQAQNYTGIWVIYENCCDGWTLDTGEHVCPYDEVDKAKAAAQADYERRIKDALETPDDQ